MKAKDLRLKTIAELQKDLIEVQKEIEKYMLNVYKGKEKNLVKTRFLRKDVAKIKTVIAEKKFMKEEHNA